MEQAVQEKIQKLQMIEENLRAFMGQRQQMQGQIMEHESALAALDDTEKSYQIIGSVMVEKPTAALKEEVTARLSQLKERSDSLEKQEQKLKKDAEALQKEVMASMKPEGK